MYLLQKNLAGAVVTTILKGHDKVRGGTNLSLPNKQSMPKASNCELESLCTGNVRGELLLSRN